MAPNFSQGILHSSGNQTTKGHSHRPLISSADGHGWNRWMDHPWMDQEQYKKEAKKKPHTITRSLDQRATATVHARRSSVGPPAHEVVGLAHPRRVRRRRRRRPRRRGHGHGVRERGGQRVDQGRGGAVVERAQRVVPAAQARLVLERLHRAHARRHHQRRRLPAHRRHPTAGLDRFLFGS